MIDPKQKLMYAIKYFTLPVALKKLEKNKNVLLNPRGETPVLYAARLGRLDLVAALIQSGANVDYQPIHSLDLLGLASHRGYDDITISFLSDYVGYFNNENQRRLRNIRLENVFS